MGTASVNTVAGTIGRRQIWLGVVVLVLGLLGHLVSAYMIRLNPRAYPDHIEGFIGIAVVTGIIIAGLGRLFWRGRRDITWMIFCALQALMGLVVLGFTLNGMR